MSSPQDPNQGQQPGWGAPQPGWDAPQPPSAPQTPPQTPPTQPGWGAPPPAQPGWGAPQGYPPQQPGYPPQQPGYPPQQPGYPPQQPGYPPQQPGYPGWGQQGWAPQPTRSNKKGCFIALGIFLVLIVVLVGGCTILFAPILGTDMKLQQDLGSRAESVSFSWNNGLTTFSITLAPGQESQAQTIACQVVKPDIASSSTPNAHFVIYDARNVWLADDTTPCS